MTPEFRVWDKQTKEYFHISNLWSSGANEDSFTFDGWKDNYGSTGFIDKITLEQYTGLKDKNGNKIFEGDILKSSQGHTRPFYYLVKYSEQYAAFTVDNLFLGGVSGVDLKPYEVAGNIHNNPELLEVEE